MEKPTNLVAVHLDYRVARSDIAFIILCVVAMLALVVVAGFRGDESLARSSVYFTMTSALVRWGLIERKRAAFYKRVSESDLTREVARYLNGDAMPRVQGVPAPMSVEEVSRATGLHVVRDTRD